MAPYPEASVNVFFFLLHGVFFWNHVTIKINFSTCAKPLKKLLWFYYDIVICIIPKRAYFFLEQLIVN